MFQEWEGALSGDSMENYFKEFCYKGRQGMEQGQPGKCGQQKGILGFVPNRRDSSTCLCCGGSCRRMRDHVLAVVLSRQGSNRQSISRGTGGRKGHGAASAQWPGAWALGRAEVPGSPLLATSMFPVERGTRSSAERKGGGQGVESLWRQEGVK